ncbi:MAG: hypothetical protein J3K34DRAFT_527270 [Monoraphidium minutum]|nr:MAG: hypothetical protein J3K34DRAFT_527270 [Monoraphidium minutum]
MESMAGRAMQDLLSRADALLPAVFYHGVEAQAQLRDGGEQAARPREQLPAAAAQAPAILANLARLSDDAASTLAHTLEAAGTGAAPLLLSSAIHASLFIEVVDRLVLLDGAKDAAAGTLARAASWAPQQEQELERALQEGSELQAAAAEGQEAADAQAFLALPGSITNAVREHLSAVLVGHVPLARLVQHALAVASCGAPAAGSGGGGGGAAPYQGAGLATSQEVHAHARALPLLLGCYMENHGRQQLLKANKAEPLSARRLERCVQWALANPVVPGYGGAPFSLLVALSAEPALQEAAGRSAKLRVPQGLAALDPKALGRLEARYALSGCATAAPLADAQHSGGGAGGGGGGGSGGGAGVPGRWLIEGHDQMADLLGLLALEVDQAAARQKEPGDKVCAAVASAAGQALQYCAATRAAITELHAWRAARGEMGDAGTSPPPGDVAPLLEAITCLKATQALLHDAEPWAEPLLRRHAKRQLDAFATTALPSIAKGAASNRRVQHLAAALQAVLMGQPGAVEALPADLWADTARGKGMSVPPSEAGDGGGGDVREFDQQPTGRRSALPQHMEPSPSIPEAGPIGEGREEPAASPSPRHGAATPQGGSSTPSGRSTPWSSPDVAQRATAAAFPTGSAVPSPPGAGSPAASSPRGLGAGSPAQSGGDAAPLAAAAAEPPVAGSPLNIVLPVSGAAGSPPAAIPMRVLQTGVQRVLQEHAAEQPPSPSVAELVDHFESIVVVGPLPEDGEEGRGGSEGEGAWQDEGAGGDAYAAADAAAEVAARSLAGAARSSAGGIGRGSAGGLGRGSMDSLLGIERGDPSSESLLPMLPAAFDEMLLSMQPQSADRERAMRPGPLSALLAQSAPSSAAPSAARAAYDDGMADEEQSVASEPRYERPAELPESPLPQAQAYRQGSQQIAVHTYWERSSDESEAEAEGEAEGEGEEAAAAAAAAATAAPAAAAAAAEETRGEWRVAAAASTYDEEVVVLASAVAVVNDDDDEEEVLAPVCPAASSGGGAAASAGGWRAPRDEGLAAAAAAAAQRSPEINASLLQPMLLPWLGGDQVAPEGSGALLEPMQLPWLVEPPASWAPRPSEEAAQPAEAAAPTAAGPEVGAGLLRRLTLRLQKRRSSAADGKAPPPRRSSAADGEAPPSRRASAADGEAPPPRRSSAADSEAPAAEGGAQPVGGGAAAATEEVVAPSDVQLQLAACDEPLSAAAAEQAQEIEAAPAEEPLAAIAAAAAAAEPIDAAGQATEAAASEEGRSEAELEAGAPAAAPEVAPAVAAPAPACMPPPLSPLRGKLQKQGAAFARFFQFGKAGRRGKGGAAEAAPAPAQPAAAGDEASGHPALETSEPLPDAACLEPQQPCYGSPAGASPREAPGAASDAKAAALRQVEALWESGAAFAAAPAATEPESEQASEAGQQEEEQEAAPAQWQQQDEQQQEQEDEQQQEQQQLAEEAKGLGPSWVPRHDSAVAPVEHPSERYSSLGAAAAPSEDDVRGSPSPAPAAAAGGSGSGAAAGAAKHRRDAGAKPALGAAAAAAGARLKRLGESLKMRAAGGDAQLEAAPPLQPPRPLDALPRGVALAAATALLEQLLLELQGDKKWRLVQQVAGRSQADAVAPGLRDAREALRAVQLLQRAGGGGLGAAVARACDLSALWAFPTAGRGGGAAAGISAECDAEGGAPGSLPEALCAAGVAGLACSRLPAETPLAALHVLRDAARGPAAAARAPGLHALVGRQAARLVRSYFGDVGALCYAHYKQLAARQLVSSEALRVARLDGPLVRVAPLGFDAVLRGLTVSVPGAPPSGGGGGSGAGGSQTARSGTQTALSMASARPHRQQRQLWSVDVTAALAASFADRFAEDATRVVATFCADGPTALVELSLQQRVLRRAHELLAEYVPLPPWQDVWARANSAPSPAAVAAGRPRASAAGDAAVLGVADMLSEAVFDSQGQVLLAPWAAAGAGEARGGACAVEDSVRCLLAPYRGFFGRQHLAALLEVEGDWAMQALLEAALERFEEAQAPLAAALCALQAELPPALLSRPSPDACHTAGALYRAYADALCLDAGGADSGGVAGAALRLLQCAGNCLALMHMANAAVGAVLPGRFAQAAPMLGITAAATGGTAAPGDEGGPAPGLRAPPFEDGAPGHFQCMLLGPNARLVTESQLLVVQSCELQAWRATRGVDCMPRCLERVGACLRDMREVLEAAAALAAVASDNEASPSPAPHRTRAPAATPQGGGAAEGAHGRACGAPLLPPAVQALQQPARPASPFAAAAALNPPWAEAAGGAADGGGSAGSGASDAAHEAGQRAGPDGATHAATPAVDDGSVGSPPAGPDGLRRWLEQQRREQRDEAAAAGDETPQRQRGSHGGTVQRGPSPTKLAYRALTQRRQHQRQPSHEGQGSQGGSPTSDSAAGPSAAAAGSPAPRSRSGPMALEASPLAQVYDETVGQLLEVLAEKERLQGRVTMLERQVQCKDEQLELFATTLRTPRSNGCSENASGSEGHRPDSGPSGADSSSSSALSHGAGAAAALAGGIAELTSRLIGGGLADDDEQGAAAGGSPPPAGGGPAGGAACAPGAEGARRPPQLPLLKLAIAMGGGGGAGGLPASPSASLSGAASAAADSGADAGTPKRPNSPPGRPRETTFPRLLPPAPPSMALPAALSALRFALLHQRGAGSGLAGGAYGDGPLWAAAAAVELLGLRRAYRRLDFAGYLGHWARYDAVSRGGRGAELAAEEDALRRAEDAAAEEDGAAARAVAAARAARAAAAEDAAAAEALVAADGRAALVWELAALAVGAQAAPPAPGAPAGGGAVAFAALGLSAPVVCGQDADPLARLPACRAPMLFADAPSRFSSAAANAERRRAVALKRPGAAPAKAGLLDASRAAHAVARFLEVAPPSAYSQSVREARSEVVSQIGSSAASDIIRGNNAYQLPPGLLASDLRGAGSSAPDDQAPPAWPQGGAAPGGAKAAAALSAAGAAAAGARPGAGESSDGGAAVPGLLGTRGRALLGRLAGAVRNNS